MSRLTRRPLRAVLALCAAFALAAPAAASADNYVALGDSFTAGNGTGSYTLSSSCYRSVYAYPYLVAQQRPNTSLSFVACSGAQTGDIMSSQIQSVNSSTNIVTVQIGGNDIHFSDLIQECTTGNCNTSLTNTRNALPGSISSKLDTVYSAIRAAAPSATVVVLGYPRLFGSSGCIGTLGVSSSERSNANLTADKLDQTIAERAAAHGFTYKSAITGSPTWIGKAICASGSWLNGLTLTDPMGSYHPTRAGHSQGYAPLVRQVIG